jgi:hypothetical protein
MFHALVSRVSTSLRYHERAGQSCALKLLDAACPAMDEKNGRTLRGGGEVVARGVTIYGLLG